MCDRRRAYAWLRLTCKCQSVVAHALMDEWLRPIVCLLEAQGAPTAGGCGQHPRLQWLAWVETVYIPSWMVGARLPHDTLVSPRYTPFLQQNESREERCFVQGLTFVMHALSEPAARRSIAAAHEELAVKLGRSSSLSPTLAPACTASSSHAELQ